MLCLASRKGTDWRVCQARYQLWIPVREGASEAQVVEPKSSKTPPKSHNISETPRVHFQYFFERGRKIWKTNISNMTTSGEGKKMTQVSYQPVRQTPALDKIRENSTRLDLDSKRTETKSTTVNSTLWKTGLVKQSWFHS